MIRHSKSAVPIAAAVAVLGLAVVVPTNATHLRPKGATPVITSIVPAFLPCPNSTVTSPNSMHARPLSVQSCKPPISRSAYLTVGTPDVNGAAANMRGYVRIDVCPVPGCQQGYAIRMHMEVSDVRCKAGTAASVCTGPNTTDGPDYSGELQSNGIIRITDHLNGANGDEAGTVVDVPFPVTIPCANTSDQTQGGFCSFDSSTGGSLMPIPDHSPPWRAVVELAQLVIYDGGADGYVGSQPNTLFAIQGFFIP